MNAKQGLASLFCIPLFLSLPAEAETSFGLSEGWTNDAKHFASFVTENYGEYIAVEAYHNNWVPGSLIAAIIIAEMSGECEIGKAGEIGIGQVIPKYVISDLRRLYPKENFEGDLCDPKHNIKITTRYVKALRDHYGFVTPERIAMAYNIGPTAARNMTWREVSGHNYVRKFRFALTRLPPQIS